MVQSFYSWMTIIEDRGPRIARYGNLTCPSQAPSPAESHKHTNCLLSDNDRFLPCKIRTLEPATLLPLLHSSELTDFWLAISGRVKPVSVIFNSLRSQCRFDTAFRSRCRFDLKWFDRCSHGCMTALEVLDLCQVGE